MANQDTTLPYYAPEDSNGFLDAEYVVNGNGRTVKRPRSTDPDAVARLTEIRDLLAGGLAGVRFNALAGRDLSGHRIVRSVDGTADYADNETPEHQPGPFWLTLGAAAAGALVPVTASGEVHEVSWEWTVGGAIYLGANGQLTQTPPAEPAAFSVQLGVALTATSLFFDPGTPIVLTP